MSTNSWDRYREHFDIEMDIQVEKVQRWLEASYIHPAHSAHPAEAAAAIGVGPDFFDANVAPELRLVRRGRKRLAPISELERWVSELRQGCGRRGHRPPIARQHLADVHQVGDPRPDENGPPMARQCGRGDLTTRKHSFEWLDRNPTHRGFAVAGLSSTFDALRSRARHG